MTTSNGATVSVAMDPEHFRRFTELGEKSGITDPSQLFTIAVGFFEKCVRARREGNLIGVVEGNAEAGKNGVVEILLSQELLALEASYTPGGRHPVTSKNS